MTRLQELAVQRLKGECERAFFYSPEYEFKSWDVREHYRFVSVYAEVGRVGDEGTLAAMYCRDRVHLFIGERGAMSYPVTSNGRYVCRRRGRKGVFTISMEQDGR